MVEATLNLEAAGLCQSRLTCLTPRGQLSAVSPPERDKIDKDLQQQATSSNLTSSLPRNVAPGLPPSLWYLGTLRRPAFALGKDLLITENGVVSKHATTSSMIVWFTLTLQYIS